MVTKRMQRNKEYVRKYQGSSALDVIKKFVSATTCKSQKKKNSCTGTILVTSTRGLDKSPVRLSGTSRFEVGKGSGKMSNNLQYKSAKWN